QTSWSLVLNLNLLTNRTLHDVICYVFFHSIPPEVASKIFVHLRPSWMYRVARVVCFTHYLLLHIIIIWHTQSSLHSHNIVFVYCEVGILPGLHFALHPLNRFVIALSFFDPPNERWFQYQVGNFYFHISSYEFDAQPFKFPY